MKRLSEPFWWSLFAAGGVVAALFMPILMILTGIYAPIRWAGGYWLTMAGFEDPFSYHRIAPLVSQPLTRLVLFVVISLPLFHWAHRFRFTLVDLGLKGARNVVAVACYGSAIVGTVLAALVLIGF